MNKLILIFGPTGVEKSTTALKLSTNRGEIISADSMQIYKGLDIGTAKLPSQKRQNIPHHLIDILNPDDYYNAYCFQTEAHTIIKTLHKQNKIPFVVGGTGLYFKALINGIFSGPGRNITLRETLNTIASSTHNTQQLYQQLLTIDPKAALKIHQSDTKRIIRAIEVYKTSHKPLSQLWEEQKKSYIQNTQRYKLLKIGLTMDRQELYEKINTRCLTMIQQGLIEEVQHLQNQGYTQDLPSMKAIGYRHFLNYLAGKTSYQTSQDEFQRDSRRFAKRQWTFFKSFENVHWFEARDYLNIEQTVHEFLNE